VDAVTAADNYFVRVADRPPVITTALPPKSKSRLPFVLFAVALVAALVVAWPHLHASHKQLPPEVLAPKPASAGMPDGLADVVRMQAESTRRSAVQAVEQAWGERGEATAEELHRVQPQVSWVIGTEPSTGPHAVSFTSDSSGVMLAVAASNHDVCAFARWTVDAGAEYVTMAHVNPCRAADAPDDGWTAEAGGAASDLPDENS
jgi:hypothetical protein